MTEFAAPTLPGAPAREDALRAADRAAVERARGAGRRLRLFWLLLGPGALVMLGENDGPSMISYAATGASAGIGFFLPFVALTFAMAYAVQETALRVAVATGRGHAELIQARFGPFWGRFAMGDLVVGNLLTLVTEFVAIRAGAAYFGVPPAVSVAAGAAVVTGSLALRRYASWERALLGLAAFNLLFVPVALLAGPDWGAVGHAFAAWGPRPPFDRGFLTLVLADIGATVTPWMIFFQQGASVDKGLARQDLRHGRLDTALGALLAALAGIAAILATSRLRAAGVDASSFAGGADFATALAPVVGPFGAALFAIAIVEAGLVAAMTISTSSSYALAESLGARRSLNLDFRSGAAFYGAAIASTLAAAGLVLWPGAPLLALTLTVNVIATLLMPPALLLLLMLANDRELMGDLANGRFENMVGGAIIAALAAAGAL
ncbi:MAG: divalent metal cation transporter, partial [Hyphomicrobiales bacterium]|nr:divalent metal cation transporter [Hyphomicrobiales bacterium]